jgi:hypothetical protein
MQSLFALKLPLLNIDTVKAHLYIPSDLTALQETNNTMQNMVGKAWESARSWGVDNAVDTTKEHSKDAIKIKLNQAIPASLNDVDKEQLKTKLKFAREQLTISQGRMQLALDTIGIQSRTIHSMTRKNDTPTKQGPHHRASENRPRQISRLDDVYMNGVLFLSGSAKNHLFVLKPCPSLNPSCDWRPETFGYRPSHRPVNLRLFSQTLLSPPPQKFQKKSVARPCMLRYSLDSYNDAKVYVCDGGDGGEFHVMMPDAMRVFNELSERHVTICQACFNLTSEEDLTCRPQIPARYPCDAQTAAYFSKNSALPYSHRFVSIGNRAQCGDCKRCPLLVHLRFVSATCPVSRLECPNRLWNLR